MLAPAEKSLWDAIREQLPPGEHDEAKRVLGQRVRRNREAWDELEGLLMMLEQFSDQNACLAEEAEAAATSRARLLHAPHRALVLQEIHLLIRQFDPALVGMLDDKDLRAYEFVRGSECTRPSTATSTAPSTSPSVGSSCASDLSVGSLRDLEASVAAVQHAFDGEYEELLARISAVNEELEGQARFQGETLQRKKVLEPSTADLQKLAKKLAQIATMPGLPEHGAGREKLPSARRVHKLRSLVESFRPATPLAALGLEAEDPSSPRSGPSLDELLFEPAPLLARPPTRDRSLAAVTEEPDGTREDPGV